MADRKLEHEGVLAEVLLHIADGTKKIRALLVQFAHKGYARDLVVAGELVDLFGLGLNAGKRGDDDNSAVNGAERPLDLLQKIDVTGRVDDIDPHALPVDDTRRRR